MRRITEIVEAWEADRDFERNRGELLSVAEIRREALRVGLPISSEIEQLESDWRIATLAVLAGFGALLPKGAPTPDDPTINAGIGLALYLADGWDRVERTWASEAEARRMLALILSGRSRARLLDTGVVEIIPAALEEPTP